MHLPADTLMVAWSEASSEVSQARVVRDLAKDLRGPSQLDHVMLACGS